jgi:ATP-dependent Clp protease ATP-binding subunit ClpA
MRVVDRCVFSTNCEWHVICFSRAERSWQADNDMAAAGRTRKMPRLALLDSTRTGKQADDLENRLGHLIVGQDEAIHQIVRAYQTHVAGLSPVGRPIGLAVVNGRNVL